jgi:hypothetical protein
MTTAGTKTIQLTRRDPAQSPAEFISDLIGNEIPVRGRTDLPVGVAISIACEHQDPLSEAGMRAHQPPPYDGFLEEWWPPGYSNRINAASPTIRTQIEVDEVVSWEYDRDWPDGTTTPGVKVISLVVRRPDISPAEFERRYRQHAEVATVHHRPGVWRYTQNITRHHDPASRTVDAVSQLWFRTQYDLAHNLYATKDSPLAVREDTSSFIDFNATRSILTWERWLRTPDPAT